MAPRLVPFVRRAVLEWVAYSWLAPLFSSSHEPIVRGLARQIGDETWADDRAARGTREHAEAAVEDWKGAVR